MMHRFASLLLGIAILSPSFASGATLHTAAFTPNDQNFAGQWYLSTIGAPAAWNTTHRSSNIIIAELDTGVDASDTNLTGALLPGFNTQSDGTDTIDTAGHGTWVAGTIDTVAPNVKILPIKVTDSAGIGHTESVAEGLRVAAQHGAKIANISFELHEGDAEVTAAAKEFYDAGGLVFAAADNDHALHSGAPNPYIISVASTGATNSASAFSSYGPYVDIAAPGEGIVTSGIGNTAVRVSGTSFASPIAAASAALVWSAHPSLSNHDVESILKSTATDIDAPGADIHTGAGLINVAAAIAEAQAGVVTAAPAPVQSQTVELPPLPPISSSPPVLPGVPATQQQLAPIVSAPIAQPIIKKITYKYKYVRVRTIVNHKVKFVWRRTLIRITA